MNINEKVKWFQLNYPKLCEDMNDCTHHYNEKYLSQYHIEGPIWSHTMMVVKLSEIFDYDDILQWSALLHDIGKPYCTIRNHDEHKARTHNHESYSTFLAIDILYNLNLPADEILMILYVINHHAILLDAIDNDENIKPDILKSFIGNRKLFEYLMKFAKIDTMGRFHEHSNRNNLGKNLYEYFLNDIETIPNAPNPINSGKSVTIMIGLPASGKSTYISENFKDVFIISRDDIVVEYGNKLNLNYNEAFNFYSGKRASTIENALYNRMKEALNHNKIVIDMTNLSKSSRKKWFKFFNHHGENYNFNAVVFLTSMDTIKTRNSQRALDGKFISDEVYDSMMKKLSLPLFSEGFSKIDYVNII